MARLKPPYKYSAYPAARVPRPGSCGPATQALDGQAGFSDLAELQAVLDQWGTYYNNYRQHSSLGYKPPVSRYTSKTYKSLGFAAAPRLPHLDMGLVKELELPDDITPQYLQRCFALVPVSPASAICS